MKRKTSDTLLILWWILIFGLTSIPGEDLPQSDIIGIDKIVHIFMYAPLAILLSIALIRRNIFGLKLFTIVIFTTLFYGIFDEWHQQFVHRTSSAVDLFVDMVGVLIVTAPCALRKPKELVHAD